MTAWDALTVARRKVAEAAAELQGRTWLAEAEARDVEAAEAAWLARPSAMGARKLAACQAWAAESATAAAEARQAWAEALAAEALADDDYRAALAAAAR